MSTYYITTIHEPIRVLCKDGELRGRLHVGPGAYSAKTFKTKRGAYDYIERSGRHDLMPAIS